MTNPTDGGIDNAAISIAGYETRHARLSHFSFANRIPVV